MTLLEEIKKLRELEQAGTKNVLSWKMLDHAPVMLEVLGCFQAGDADRLVAMVSCCRNACDTMSADGICDECRKDSVLLARLQRAASLMEQEEREG